MAIRVGYHWVSIDELSNEPLVPLSMGLLHNDRPLFLCNNPVEWCATHLPQQDKICYMVEYVEPLKTWSTRSFDEYTSLFSYDLDHNRIIPSAVLGAMLEEGYRKFELSPDNDVRELSEFILMESRAYVRSIQVYSMSQVS